MSVNHMEHNTKSHTFSAESNCFKLVSLTFFNLRVTSIASPNKGTIAKEGADFALDSNVRITAGSFSGH